MERVCRGNLVGAAGDDELQGPGMASDPIVGMEISEDAVRAFPTDDRTDLSPKFPSDPNSNMIPMLLTVPYIKSNNGDSPRSMKEIEADEWLIAMKSEIDSIYQNKVWTLMDLPEGARPIECKWVFKCKMDKDGNVHVCKARLVARGFKQIQGIDYDETFFPVVKFKSIRIILAIAAYYDYEIWQMDVKNAFLNGNLEV
ncbi:transmembrane signal receptor [Lithospermum erythrorhizon]|uniref:Transmembrane signal receptor n=1 Tax=Lithospermum erythrorhizon TaxID=34254 RepID=A0AAV3Q5S3_LITER